MSIDSPPSTDQIVVEYTAKRGLYSDFGTALEGPIQSLFEGEGIRVTQVESRPKEPASLRRKISQKYTGLMSCDEVDDLCGVRVVLYYQSDLERARDLISEDFEIVSEDLHEAENPEVFGYQSRHHTIRIKAPRDGVREWKRFQGLKAEVQVRTVLQHAWALISHELDYNREEAVPAKTKRKLSRLSALLELADEQFDVYRELAESVRDKYREEISLGEWRRLPLDLDSLVAAGSEIDFDRASNLGAEAGFMADEIGFAIDDDPVARRELGDLVSTATAVGLGSVGELADFVTDRLPGLKPQLEKIAGISASQGFTPLAYAPHVIEIGLLVASEVPLEQSIFRDSIIGAITEVRKQRPRD